MTEESIKRGMGRPPLRQEQLSEPTRPYSVRLTAAEIAELKRRRVRGPGSLAEWLGGSGIRSRKEAAVLANRQFDDVSSIDADHKGNLEWYATVLYSRKKARQVHYGRQEVRELLDFIYGGEPSSGEEISPGSK